MSIISGFNKVKNYVKTTEGYKLLSRWTSSDTVDVNGKTLTEVVDELGTASKKDVAASGNASTTQVVMGNDTRLTDARKASDVSAWAKASTKPTYTASEVGLGNVGNFKAVSTVASQGLTDTEKSNARANIGAQVAGSYASASHTHDDRYYTESEINTKLNGKANSSHTHGNGDITSLDASKITSGTIDLARLPQGALDRLIKVADDTARFKLTTKDVQLGDSVKVTNTKKMYIVIDEMKLSSEAGYEPYTADSATSVPWSGVTGKPSTYTPSSHTHTKSQITDFPTSMPASDVPAWAKASTKPSYTKSEVGLGNVDNTADSAKSVKYATSAGSATSASKATGVVDYGATTKTIQIGYSGDGISGDAIKYIAGYTTGNGSDVNAKIKDVSKDALKSWLGLGSLAYSSATIPTIPSSLPANGGNSSTVNGHTVNSDVPANAKFTDTDTTYTVGTDSYLGITKLYSSIGTNTDGTMTQNAIKIALEGKSNTDHTHSGYATTETVSSLSSSVSTLSNQVYKSTGGLFNTPTALFINGVALSSNWAQLIIEYNGSCFGIRNDGGNTYLMNGNTNGWTNYCSFNTNGNWGFPGNVTLPGTLTAGGLFSTGGLCLAGRTNAQTTAKPNAYIDSAGNVYKSSTTSSKRFKEDVKLVENEDLNPENLYDIDVVQFKYKKSHFTNKEDPRYRKDMIGLIAENVYEHYPMAADYHIGDDGNVVCDGWNEQYLIPAMLKLIQDQHMQLINQEMKIKILEDKVMFM